jgi:hypothetical protein
MGVLLDFVYRRFALPKCISERFNRHIHPNLAAVLKAVSNCFRRNKNPNRYSFDPVSPHATFESLFRVTDQPVTGR